MDGRHYVIAETGPGAHWVQNLAADPRVSWRIGDAAFGGRARLLDQASAPERVRAVRRLSEAKYGWGDGLIIELTPD